MADLSSSWSGRCKTYVSWSITNTNLEAQHAGVKVLHHGVEVAVGHVREEDGQLLLDPALPAAAAQAEEEVS